MGADNNYLNTEKPKSLDTDFAVKWISTPKHCKDCTPTAEKVKRRSCTGCTKYFYKDK